MKKLLLSITALIVLSGCTTHTNMNKDPKFKEILSKQYQTRDDFVVLTLQDNKKEYILHKFGRQGVPSREELETNQLPFQYYGNTIYGILPKGTQFKVINVTFMRSFETSQTYYEAEILDGPFQGYKIDVSLLTGAGDVPQFLPEYAAEVAPQQSK